MRAGLGNKIHVALLIGENFGILIDEMYNRKKKKEKKRVPEREWATIQ